MFGGDAGLHALIDPFVFAAPINVALGLEHIGAAAAEAEHGAAHALDRDIAGQDEQVGPADLVAIFRSEEHTSELQSLMRISYAVFCLKKKKQKLKKPTNHNKVA